MDDDPNRAETGETTPETMLDALRDHPEWDDRRRDQALDRLVARFEADRLLNAARARLDALGGSDGEAVLRLIEAFGGPADLEALAKALTTQPDLPPERAWEVLELLEGSGWIENDPSLVERREELDEVIDGEDDVLAILSAQLEDATDGPWLALQGLGAIEPGVRAEILEGLAARPSGPGMVEFFRLLAFAHDPKTRKAAIDGLKALPDETPGLAPAWASLAVDHPAPEIRAIGLGKAGFRGGNLPASPIPKVVRSLVSSLDGQGRGHLAILAEDRGIWAAAAFECDVRRGITGVFGQVGRHLDDAGRLLDELVLEAGRETLENAHELALALLAAGLSVSGPATPPALRFWLERTAGPRLRPRPLLSCLPDARSTEPDDEVRTASAEAILDACPGWVDDSNLTYELAEELRLRNRASPPDPVRDAGAFRFLFENRLHARLGFDAAMLAWMAAFWNASGKLELARAAASHSRQLADPQHAVPANAFVSALAARSLLAAQANLARGVDLRVARNRGREAR